MTTKDLINQLNEKTAQLSQSTASLQRLAMVFYMLPLALLILRITTPKPWLWIGVGIVLAAMAVLFIAGVVVMIRGRRIARDGERIRALLIPHRSA